VEVVIDDPLLGGPGGFSSPERKGFFFWEGLILFSYEEGWGLPEGGDLGRGKVPLSRKGGSFQKERAEKKIFGG